MSSRVRLAKWELPLSFSSRHLELGRPNHHPNNAFILVVLHYFPCSREKFRNLPANKQTTFHSSIAHASATTGQELKKPSSDDRKRSELVHKEEKSFWRSWFGLGSSYDSDSDSDDERKHKKNDSKFNSNRPHGPKLSTRKSSAERQTNFNAPTEEEKLEAKLAKVSRASIREIRWESPTAWAALSGTKFLPKSTTHTWHEHAH